jgi:hypothetical protein
MDANADMDTDTPGNGDDPAAPPTARLPRRLRRSRARHCRPTGATVTNGSITVNPRRPRPDSGLHAQRSSRANCARQ